MDKVTVWGQLLMTVSAQSLCPTKHNASASLWTPADLSWDLQHPGKKQGVVTCIYNPFLRNRETWWFMGLTGHQPSQKMAACRFGERPGLNRIKQRNIGCLPLTSSCAHTHTHTCVYTTHTTPHPQAYTHISKTKEKKDFYKIEIIIYGHFKQYLWPGMLVTCGNWFSPSSMWVPGIELQL